MPKQKTHRGLAKRVRKTASGKLKRGQAYRSHLAPRKTTKQKRQLRRPAYVHKSDYKRIKQQIATMK